MSKLYNVTIKWGKETYTDVEVDMNQPPMVFKQKLYDLTKVEPERQKILLKGGTLGNDEWAPCRVKKNQVIMLMGTRGEEMVKEPVDKPVFIEDMNQSEAQMTALAPGLINLGNTCYMNATLQCLAKVTPLRAAIEAASASKATALGKITMSLFSTMDKATGADAQTTEQLTKAVEELTALVLMALRERNPQFAERGERGGFAQQDADECLNVFMQVFKELDSGAVASLFGLKIKETLKCKEDEAEEATIKEKTEESLSFATDVPTHVHAGLKQLLKEEIEKRSDTLDRNAVYEKTLAVDRLPAFLVLKGLRFEFHQGKKRKILRPVKYSMNLDMYDMCTDELKAKLKPMREQILEASNQRVEAQKLKKQKTDDDDAMDIESKTSYSFADDPGSNCHGYYDLVGILSHRGRSSNSGHYIAWTKQKNGTWLKFDDDKVSETTTERVLEIAGGRPDSDISYILFYESVTPDLST